MLRKAHSADVEAELQLQLLVQAWLSTVCQLEPAGLGDITLNSPASASDTAYLAITYNTLQELVEVSQS